MHTVDVHSGLMKCSQALRTIGVVKGVDMSRAVIHLTHRLDFDVISPDGVLAFMVYIGHKSVIFSALSA